MRYIQTYIERSSVGSGTRCFLVLEESEMTATLFYIPRLREITVSHNELSRVRDIEKSPKDLSQKIRAARKEYCVSGMGFPGSVVQRVLTDLQGQRKLTKEEKEDDALWGASKFGEDKMNTITQDAVEATDKKTTPAKPAKAAAKNAKPAKPAKAAKPANAAAKNAKPAKPAKAAKPAKPEKDRKIKLLTKGDSPYRGKRGERFNLLKSGMKESEYAAVLAKNGYTKSQISGALRFFESEGHITLT